MDRAACRSGGFPIVLRASIIRSKEVSAMQYVLQIFSNGGNGGDAFAGLSQAEKDAVMGEYMAISQSQGIVGGAQLQPPETATTVRVQDGSTLTTDGPFTETKE